MQFFDSRSGDLFRLSKLSVYFMNETTIPFETEDVGTWPCVGKTLLFYKLGGTTEPCLTPLRTGTTADSTGFEGILICALRVF